MLYLAWVFYVGFITAQSKETDNYQMKWGELDEK